MLKLSDKMMLAKLFEKADVKINGLRSWDITVNNEDFHERVMRDGLIGLGEAYVDGWWEVEKLDEFVCKALNAGLDERLNCASETLVSSIKKMVVKARNKPGEVKNACSYGLGNDLFEAMLDRRLIYSCGYFHDAKNLEEAQIAKLDLICRKLHLKKDMNIMDIGCGWGGFAKFACEKYSVKVIGITVSPNQFEYAKENCHGWSDVDIRFQDYRDIPDRIIDRVISTNMFEHIGKDRYRDFMKIVSERLMTGGLFLLQTIGSSVSNSSNISWVKKYISPSVEIPTISQIAEASQDFFVMEDLHNFGQDYDRTLMAWFKNFDNHWPTLASKYDGRFYRMWKYYLLAGAGSFRARKNQLWQIVFSPKNRPYQYRSVR